MQGDMEQIETDEAAVDPSLQIAPLPRISIQAFCDSLELSSLIEDIALDRRLSKTHIKVNAGGGVAAVEAYRSAPTPNLIIIESQSSMETLIGQLDELAEFCDPGTKVVIIGRNNDIALYRELIARGVSDYLVAPLDRLTLIRALSELYSAPGVNNVGRVVAVTGAKGGVGASVLAHNIAWATSGSQDIATIIVDMDLPFGTTGLDFNQDPPQGIADAVFSPDRTDANFLDRLISKCTDKLGILAPPATLERLYDFNENAFDGIIDLLRASTPLIILDVPHGWTAWTRKALVSADELIVVATPDLASLRNTKSLIDTLRAARPNDARPKLILNMVGVPKRPEITAADFAKALDVGPLAVIPFEPKLFGTAANNGQMISEVDSKSKIAETIDGVARSLLGRSEIRAPKRSLLQPLVSKLRRK